MQQADSGPAALLEHLLPQQAPQHAKQAVSCCSCLRGRRGLVATHAPARLTLGLTVGGCLLCPFDRTVATG
jgi:hypothetical protein